AEQPGVSEAPRRGATGVAGRPGMGGRAGKRLGAAPDPVGLVDRRPAFPDDLAAGPSPQADHPGGPLENPRRAPALDPGPARTGPPAAPRPLAAVLRALRDGSLLVASAGLVGAARAAGRRGGLLRCLGRLGLPR